MSVDTLYLLLSHSSTTNTHTHTQKLMAFETEPFGDKRVPGLLQPWQEKVLDALDLAPKINGTPYWPPVCLSVCVCVCVCVYMCVYLP